MHFKDNLLLKFSNLFVPHFITNQLLVMKLKPKAILFDMDGVLVDSIDSWFLSLNSALEAFGHKKISMKEFVEKYWGHDLYDNLRKMNLPLKVVAFCNNVYSNNTNKIKIYNQTRPTLEKLGKYKKAIITNTPKDCTIKILKQFNIESFFEFVMTSDDVSMGKPDPEIVLKACKRFKVRPKDVLLIGDTDNDVKAGKAAGCIVVGLNVDADFIIKNISELNFLLE